MYSYDTLKEVWCSEQLLLIIEKDLFAFNFFDVMTL